MSSEAQLDGSADTCSSRSSVDKSQPPSPAVAAIFDEAAEDDDSNHSPRTMTAKRAFPPPNAAAAARKTILANVGGGMNIIQQRMKQTQQSPPTTANSPASISSSSSSAGGVGGGGNMRPKSKLSLIRHVFKTYTKGRRVVDVKVRWAESKISDLDEYLRLRRDGEKDEEYDEQGDREGTVAQPPPPSTPLKRPLSSEEAVAGSPSSSPNPKRSRSGSVDTADGVNEESVDGGEEWSASMFDFESLRCRPCSKTFPNAARLSAHKQMHVDEMRKKKKRCKVATGQRPKKLPQLDGAFDVDFDSEDGEEEKGELVDDHHGAAGLPQLDGENDVMMPTAPASVQVTGPPTTSTASQQQRQNGGGQSVIFTTSAPPPAVVSNVTAATPSNPTHVFIVRAPQQQTAGASLPASQFLVKQEAAFQQQSSCKSSPTGAQSSTASTSRSSSSPVSAVNALPTYAKELLVLEHAHPMLIKQDPVMFPLSSVVPSKSGGSEGGGGGFMATDAAIVDHDLILPDALHLFEGTPALDSSDSAIQISLDDIANFAQPINTSGGGLGSVGFGGAESHASFDTSIETSSFLSGADALDIVSETTNGTNTSGIRFVH